MSNALAHTPTEQDWSLIEKVVIEGDLSKLSKEERVTYYRMYCESLGLNPTTRPFDYIRLNGKLVLYAKKDATEQLRKNHNVSVDPKISAERIDDLYVVTVTARLANGRTDADMGAVNVTGLKGEALANAMLKAITKAKRRVTLSICGLGVLDESEIHSIPNAQLFTEVEDERAPEGTPMPAPVVTEDGEIIDVDSPGQPPQESVTSAEYIKAIQESATPDGVAVLWQGARDSFEGDDLALIETDVKVRLAELMDGAETKEDLQAVAAAVKKAELSSDWFRKKYTDAKARILTPEPVS